MATHREPPRAKGAAAGPGPAPGEPTAPAARAVPGEPAMPGGPAAPAEPAEPAAPTGAAAQPPARPTALDPPMVPFAVGGIIVWAVVGLALLPLRGWLDAHGHGSWLKICLAGFLWGFVGLAVMVRHDANRRRRHATGATEAAD